MREFKHVVDSWNYVPTYTRVVLVRECLETVALQEILDEEVLSRIRTCLLRARKRLVGWVVFAPKTTS